MSSRRTVFIIMSCVSLMPSSAVLAGVGCSRPTNEENYDQNKPQQTCQDSDVKSKTLHPRWHIESKTTRASVSTKKSTSRSKHKKQAKKAESIKKEKAVAPSQAKNKEVEQDLAVLYLEVRSHIKTLDKKEKRRFNKMDMYEQWLWLVQKKREITGAMVTIHEEYGQEGEGS